ncbi:MAG: pyridoxine 5'-phosphate synthase [Candidatus Omnitrophica bacterium]|nr:pyridoxine 5'-phosphate synthase [Candidatus Omnitrophota bacterium]
MKLGVNIDHVATLRQARRAKAPDPIKAARICEEAGCDSIVCHLREDRRHINEGDLRLLRKTVKSKLNLEMACAEEIVKIALEVLPDQATLVPERREEITTEGGLDVLNNRKRVAEVVERLQDAGMIVSLFIDPQESQIRSASEIKVKCIELHTGKFANASSAEEVKKELRQLKTGAQLGLKLGLEVFAGHGLDYDNVKDILQINKIQELNIGHSIISRSIFVGLDKAVSEMIHIIKTFRPCSIKAQ